MNVNEITFKAWLERHEPYVDSADRPTMKNLLFLAFLETEGEECNYGGLKDLIVKHGGADEEAVKREALRVAVGDLSKTLEDMTFEDEKTSFRIVRIGRGKFRLEKFTTPPPRITSPQVFTSIPLNHRHGNPEQLARNVIGRMVLPFHALYYLPKSAAWWAHFSSDEAAQRSPVEAAAWKVLEMDHVVSEANRSGVLSVVGLAVGEGQGEIAILQKILNDEKLDKTVQVHYLAVDLSPSLLLHHAQNLTMALQDEMFDSRLICATVLGDIFDLNTPHSRRTGPERDLHPVGAGAGAGDAHGVVEKEEKEKAIIARSREIVSADFLPWNSPMVVTYLGNCLGNGEKESERKFFEIIRTRLGENLRADDPKGAGTLQCLIGVSVDEGKEIYKRNWDEFLLQGLRRLVEHGFIHDHRDGKGQGVFEIPEVEKGPNRPPAPFAALGILAKKGHRDGDSQKGIPEVENQVTSEEYSANFNLKGRRYVFEHILNHSISTTLSGIRYSVSKNCKIVLYAITKYDMRSMLKFVKQLGFTPTGQTGKGAICDGTGKKIAEKREGGWIREEVHTKNGRRHYGVFCVKVNPPIEK